MEKFFKPKSVAIIGVSESPTNMGKNIVGNLLEFGFKGIIYQVGKSEGALFSRKIYKSVLDIEDKIELAVILTPAETIPDILKECGEKGIKRVIIESAGFSEFGAKGRELEEKIVRIAKNYSIRFIGPNCIGTMNLHTGLATSFVPFHNKFQKGSISIISQSGGVGFSYLTIFESENLGLAKFASIGNKLNVNENDLLEYLIDDPETKIICIYLESIHDGQRLMQIARTSKKPILLHKANIGELASEIAKSHTAALSSNDAVVSAALQQAGIARVADRESLVNTLKILPLPKMKGNRLVIISRSGGHAIIAADASETCGFKLASLSKNFIKSVEKHLRAKVIRLTNPMDIGDLFDYKIFAQIIEKTLLQANVDGVVFMHTYFSATEGASSRELFNKIAEFSKKYDKPVGICIATDEEELQKLRKEIAYPIFSVPTHVIRALAYSRDYYLRHVGIIPPAPPLKKGGIMKHPPLEKGGIVKHPPLEKGGRGGFQYASKIIRSCLRQKRNPLLQEGMEILKSYGIPIVKSLWVKNTDEARRAAEKIGYPVAMKIVSQKISHKTDIGGVRLNIKNEEQLREEYKSLMRIAPLTPTLSPRGRGIHEKFALPSGERARVRDIESVIIQPMLAKGWEMILGAKQDPNFGPVVLAGLGGIFVEIFKDTSIRVVGEKGDRHPSERCLSPFCLSPFLPTFSPREMLKELKGYKILEGARGDKPYDIAAAESAILKLSRLIADFPEIKEIDINPFYVLHKGKGGFALDARIIL